MNGMLLALQEVTLPAADPLPLPAPPIIFLFLLYLTFVLHMVAMNFTVGGTLIQAFAGFRKSENLEKLSSFLSYALPICLSFTVTLGIAPLLFIQVLYGQIFFTTSVIMAWPWLGMLALLMIAYYGLYFYQFKRKEIAWVRKWVPVIAFVLLVLIMLTFIMNFRLFFRAEEWQQLYHGESSGFFLNIMHPQVIPALFHFLTAAIAVSGLLVVIHGWIKKGSDEGYSGWAARFGGLLFVIPTALQFLFGTLLLMSLPRDQIKAFMFGDPYATAILFTGMGAGVLGIIFMLLVALKRSFGFPVIASGLFIAVAISAMTLVRAYSRDMIINHFYDMSQFEVAPQWDTIIIFGVLLVGGLATVGWMIYKVITGKGPEEEFTVES